MPEIIAKPMKTTPGYDVGVKLPYPTVVNVTIANSTAFRKLQPLTSSSSLFHHDGSPSVSNYPHRTKKIAKAKGKPATTAKIQWSGQGEPSALWVPNSEEVEKVCKYRTKVTTTFQTHRVHDSRDVECQQYEVEHPGDDVVLSGAFFP